MNENVGGRDRIGRIVLGVVSLLVGMGSMTGYVAIGPIAGGVAIAIGGMLLVTAGLRKCPINDAAGIDTTNGSRD
ncbi:MAG: YgaP family membrane protein [Halobacteriota archaeon]